MHTPGDAHPAEPRLAFGTMLFGTRTDERTAFALLDRFVERGGRWIDTANCYAFWLSPSGRGDDSERVIARWLAALTAVADRLELTRGQVVLAWLAGGRHPVVPIVGVSTIAQLDQAIDAATTALPEDLRAELDGVEP